MKSSFLKHNLPSWSWYFKLFSSSLMALISFWKRALDMYARGFCLLIAEKRRCWTSSVLRVFVYLGALSVLKQPILRCTSHASMYSKHYFNLPIYM